MMLVAVSKEAEEGKPPNQANRDTHDAPLCRHIVEVHHIDGRPHSQRRYLRVQQIILKLAGPSLRERR